MRKIPAGGVPLVPRQLALLTTAERTPGSRAQNLRDWQHTL
jgi:hypothetical protein